LRFPIGPFRLADKVHCTCTLNLAGDRTMHFCRHTGHLARKDPAGFGSELGKNLWILEADLFEWKVETLSGHRLVVLPEINSALNGLRLRHDI